jgi:hypothetical protein
MLSAAILWDFKKGQQKTSQKPWVSLQIFPLSEPRSCFFPRPLDRAIYFVLDIFDHHIMANLKYIHLGKS